MMGDFTSAMPSGIPCSPDPPPKPRPWWRKLVVAVAEDGSGAAYSTRGGPRIGFATATELLHAVARGLAHPHPGTPRELDCRCAWIGFTSHTCGHLGLLCGSCGTAWCPCQGEPPDPNDPLAILLRSWAAH